MQTPGLHPDVAPTRILSVQPVVNPRGHYPLWHTYTPSRSLPQRVHPEVTPQCTPGITARRRSSVPSPWSIPGVSKSSPVVTVHRGQQADGDACRAGVDVDPERDPREDDDQHTGHVDLYEEVAEVTAQNEPDIETRKGS